MRKQKLELDQLSVESFATQSIDLSATTLLPGTQTYDPYSCTPIF